VHILAKLAGGLAVVAMGALAGCDKQKLSGPLSVYKGPLMETTNVLTLISDSAKLKFQLTAPLEQQFENGDVIYPKGMVVTFYSADGKKNVINTLTAKYGKVDKVKNLYIMRGAVRVVNIPQQQRMDTEELFFDKTKQVIYTDSAMAVRMETPTEILLGKGLWARQDLSRYRIFHPTGIFDKAGMGL
jgi:LPS export ABC transporter protein LptC